MKTKSTANRQFRAVKWERDKSTLVIESSLDGSVWEQAIAGLDSASVQRYFEKLNQSGKKIINTTAFKFTVPKIAKTGGRS